MLVDLPDREGDLGEGDAVEAKDTKATQAHLDITESNTANRHGRGKTGRQVEIADRVQKAAPHIAGPHRIAVVARPVRSETGARLDEAVPRKLPPSGHLVEHDPPDLAAQ